MSLRSVVEDDLVRFLTLYFLVLAAPGPNLIAIGGTAALQGWRRATRLCVGTALGACLLSVAVLLLGKAALALAAHGWRTVGAVVGAVMLLWVASSLARMPRPGPGDVPTQRSDAAAFTAGLLNAATNPVTGAFFASQFLGTLGGRGGVLAFIPPLVFATALSFFLCVSAVLARPAFRVALEAWHRPVRLAAAAALVFMAAFALAGASAGLGWRPSAPALAAMAILACFLGCFALLGSLPSRAVLEAWRRPVGLAAAAALVFAAGLVVGNASARLGWTASVSLPPH